MASRSARAPSPWPRTGDAAMAAPRPFSRAFRHRRRALAIGLWPGALCLAWACAGGPERHHAPVAVEHELQPDGGPPATGHHHAGRDPAAGGAGPALTEAAARALLAERFRAAGLRVRYDVQVVRNGAFELTVDGYDPARRVGFEYVARDEAGADLDPAERSALARDREQRILIIDEVGGTSGAEADQAAAIAALADRFLQALEAPGTPAVR